jgi:hypothetical protein
MIPSVPTLPHAVRGRGVAGGLVPPFERLPLLEYLSDPRWDNPSRQSRQFSVRSIHTTECTLECRSKRSFPLQFRRKPPGRQDGVGRQL